MRTAQGCIVVTRARPRVLRICVTDRFSMFCRRLADVCDCPEACVCCALALKDGPGDRVTRCKPDYERASEQRYGRHCRAEGTENTQGLEDRDPDRFRDGISLARDCGARGSIALVIPAGLFPDSAD